MAKTTRASKSDSVREAEALLDIARAFRDLQHDDAEKADKSLLRVPLETRASDVVTMEGRSPVQRRQTADEDEPVFGLAYKQGVLLQPPWLPGTCYGLYEESDILGSCARAYVDNIEREYDYEYVGLAEDKEKDEVKFELRKLQDFFSQVNERQSWQQVRRQARLDQVITANSYCEVLEDPETLEPQLVYHVPGTWMRISELDVEATLTNVKMRRGGKIVEVPLYRRFRRFCRWMPSRSMQWFKEFGDPRVVDKLSGEYYKDPEDGTYIYEADLRDQDKLDRYASLGLRFDNRASSIWWNADRYGGSPYGIPIWIGAMAAIRGAYLAAWVNYDTLDHSGLPPWLLLIYGKLASGTRKYLDNIIKSWRNPKVFSEPGIVEIEPNLLSFNSTGGNKAGAEFVSMRDMRNEESMFAGYTKQCWELVGAVFRLHPILYGITQGTGGANYAALETVQNQVWGPIQAAEDERVNVELVQNAFNIFNWRVRTRPAPIGDQEQQYKAVGMASRAMGPSAEDLVKMENRILGTDWEVPDSPLYKALPAAEAAALIRASRVKYDKTTMLPVEIVDPPTGGQMGGEGGGDNGGEGGKDGLAVPGKTKGDGLPASPSFGAAKSDDEIIEEQAAADTINLFNAMKRIERKVKDYKPPNVHEEATL
jgi:capsid portal protein